jgi:serine/threonine-protein kinase
MKASPGTTGAKTAVTEKKGELGAKTHDESAIAKLPAMGATAYDADRPPLPPGAREDGDPLIGRRIDHFEIRGLLGEGGMGTVYLAHDCSLERPVAIKVLRREMVNNPDLVERLVMEARAQARLQHSNVVTIYHIGTYEGAPYFAMEYVRGRTLADHIGVNGALPWANALECIVQTTRALMAAQRRGIVHRDIKPSNLISTAAGEVKVADFGLAAPPGWTEQYFVGSPYYASPEQIAGQPPDFRSDLYSLGVTFHELLTGAPPFRADSLAEMAELHQNAPRPAIPDRKAPWRLRQLIIQMMSPDPTERPATYEELLGRLESLRPRPLIAGGIIPRFMALTVDLTMMAAMGQLIAGLFILPHRVAHEISFLLFAIYYVVTHRVWGRTLGKLMFGQRLQGTTRHVSVLGLSLRFIVEFWGPIVAILMIHLQLGAAKTTTMAAVKDHLTNLVGVDALPIFDDGAEEVLRTLLVPNLVLAVPWLAGFLFALFDDNRQALHERAAHTRVVYAIRDGADHKS